MVAGLLKVSAERSVWLGIPFECRRWADPAAGPFQLIPDHETLTWIVVVVVVVDTWKTRQERPLIGPSGIY